MILASFDAERNRDAAISGAYQYDTGQRIRMHGLPGPDELAEMDDFLSGDVVTVEAQFGYVGDSQSEPRLAQYDDEEGAWLVDVPDAYLTRAETVHVYVYVMYGSDTERSRAKTMYRGSFTPIGRPAPSTTVTPDQLSAWDALVAEVNLTLAQVNSAISGANAAASGATEAINAAGAAVQAARSAADKAEVIVSAWGNATASASTLSAGSNATVSVTEKNGVKHFTFGIPRGATGAQGSGGSPDVSFRLSGTTLYITTT